MRIEVCGGIAAGKTTLACLVSDRLGWTACLENFRDNPFWEAFYTNPGEFIFETEITFLLQHYHQSKKLLGSPGVFICDYSFLLDAAYADIGLMGTQQGAFERVHEEVTLEIGPPDLLVYLNCPPEIELARIQARSRPEEQLISLEFLTELNAAVARRVLAIQERVPTLLLDSSSIDFATSTIGERAAIERVMSALTL